MPYNPTTGGHAPSYLREAFQSLVDGEHIADPERLTGLLWNCTDTMPASTCHELELRAGSTYAQGARSLRRTYA